MEITWNGNLNKVPFEVVDVGHTFIYNEKIYMRTTNIYIGTDRDRLINAVNIENGIVVTFCDDDYITPIEGKFVMD